MTSVPLSVAEFNYAGNLQIAKNLICQHMDEPNLDDTLAIEIHNLVMLALRNGWEQGATDTQKAIRRTIGIYDG